MCEVTSGRTATPCDAPGGVEQSWVFDFKQKATLVITNGAVASITLKPGKYAYPLVYEAETAKFNDTSSGTTQASSYARTQVTTLVLAGNQATDVVMHDANGKTRVCLIHKLEDGSYELYNSGKGGKWIDSRDSGTVFEDLNGATVTVTGKEKYRAPKISLELIQALLSPSS